MGLSNEIQAALASLPEEFRVPVVLCDVADQSYEQIAHTLGVPGGDGPLADPPRPTPCCACLLTEGVA